MVWWEHRQIRAGGGAPTQFRNIYKTECGGADAIFRRIEEERKQVTLPLPSSLIVALNLKKVSREEFKNQWKISLFGLPSQQLLTFGPFQTDQQIISQVDDFSLIFKNSVVLTPCEKVSDASFVKLGMISSKFILSSLNDILIRVLYQKQNNQALIQICASLVHLKEAQELGQWLCFYLIDKQY